MNTTYIDGREAEAIPNLERAIELGDDYPSTYELLRAARAYVDDERSPQQDGDTEGGEEWSFTTRAHVTLKLNMRLLPEHRDDRIGDGIDMMLRDKGWGCVSGGGTLVSRVGEPLECDIEIDLAEDSKAMWHNMLSVASKLDGIAKGSGISYRSAGNPDSAKVHPVGKLEGIAIYINGTDLPDDVYETCDIGFAVDCLMSILGNNGTLIWSYWEGPRETALYFYAEGRAEDLLDKVTPFLAEYPLLRGCRTELLAHDETVATNKRHAD